MMTTAKKGAMMTVAAAMMSVTMTTGTMICQKAQEADNPTDVGQIALLMS
jgi:archaellin